MKWKKMGLIISPDRRRSWMQSHASVPCAEHLSGNIYRIYFCSRDSENRSQIGYVHIDFEKPHQILYRSSQPVLTFGSLGCFDDCGVTPTWITKHGKKTYLYYVGWHRGSTVRMHLFAGLAVSHDNGKSFQRHSLSPVLERCSLDPYLTATLSILKENKKWKMWYVSGEGWFKSNKETYPRYNIKYAESDDGIHWDRQGKVCIDFASKSEYAIARPCVVKHEGLYRMWYCHKGEDYIIGYAESQDGINWQRMDSLSGLTLSHDGWDSKMIAYPFVFFNRGRFHLLYNGNAYGIDGIGYAVSY